MMKKLYSLLYFTFLISLALQAQRESSNWFFGDNAGLDFNQGTPQIILNGRLSTTEGCSTVSDTFGNLLFYTDGSTVWNKNHGVMTNGEDLKGNYSSSQSAIIVPNVTNPNIYYIFTADVANSYFNNGVGNGFNYSIIDLSVNNGLGRVINKNINLIQQASEKVSAISAFDGTGYWVVTQANDSFYAYKVDGTGVNLVPVISRIGPDISNFNNTRGCIKFSPNGKKMAVSHAIFSPNLSGSINLYDFNVVTGAVSAEEVIARDRVFYGVEFSSKSSRLYASGRVIDDRSGFPITKSIQLYQYDLEAVNIERSEYLLNSYEEEIPGDLAGTLQIAFDKKIYHSITNDNLSVIREPNLPQVSCDFRRYSIDLGNSLARFGLPSYVQSSFESILNIDSLCFNNSTQFSLIAVDQIQAVTWDFGDPNSGLQNNSSLINPVHTFSQTGIFPVTFTVDFLNRESHTYIEFIEINEVPQTLNNVTLTQCDIDGDDDGISRFNLSESEKLFNLGNENLIATYYKTLDDLVNNVNPLNEDDYENENNNQVIFAKVFENVECYSVTEVTLNVKNSSDLGLYSTIFNCNPIDIDNPVIDLVEVETLLSRDFNSSEISFYISDNDALLERNEVLDEITFSATQVQELFFRVENINACDNIGKLDVSIVTSPEVVDQELVYCANKDNILDAGSGFVSYLWSSGETTQRIVIQQEGEYWAEVSHGDECSDIINFRVTLSEEIEILDVIINDFRSENSVEIVLKNYEGNLQYSIDGGQTFTSNNIFTNVPPNLYEVVVVRNDCNFARTTILVGGFPNFFTPNGDGVNDTWQIKNPEYFQEAKIEIYDRYGKHLKTILANDSWDGKYEGRLATPTDYWFSIKLNHKIVYGHFSLKL